MRCLLAVAWVLLIGLPAHAQVRPDLEKGIAITDPATLEALERRGFGLADLFANEWVAGRVTSPANNARLRRNPALARVILKVEGEINDYHRELLQRARTLPEADQRFAFGFGIRFNRRLFEARFLSMPEARFTLVGVVNRMDRAYVAANRDTCGEVRFVYRLAYEGRVLNGPPGATGEVVEARSRLPMTFNLVLRAKAPGSTVTCAEIARRWLRAGELTDRGAALAAKLYAPTGPLALVSPAEIDRLETNLQLVRWPATIYSELGGHAEYLLRVWRWTGPGEGRGFVEQPLENQIDGERLRRPENAAALADLQAWLLAPETIKALDRGTIEVPERFLAYRAISVAPGGSARTMNRTARDLVTDEATLSAALAAANAPRGTLLNISSPAGFQRRLNDIGCVGCHQSRAVGGFHLMGRDTDQTIKWLPENAIFVPLSAHFYGDAPRRRKVVEAFARGTPPDFARGFSLRPRRSLVPASFGGSGFLDGWGAACYTGGDDPSFKAWTCAKHPNGRRLACRLTHESAAEPGIGTCAGVPGESRSAMGDPGEFGRVVPTAAGLGKGLDKFVAFSAPPSPPLDYDKRAARVAPQSGGFFGGMLRRTSCNGSMPAEAVCARAAGNGFNTPCLSGLKSFKHCVMNNTNPEGLRACDMWNPCRDDYICVATRPQSRVNVRTSERPLDDVIATVQKRGACLPPYFLFQFRLDGHPASFVRGGT